ncbi:MAG: glycosyltransferase [bacterium]|nr:glycosyltransferase [bacterium]
MKQSAYILVTPAKNEEKNIPGLVEAIVKQTIRPAIWCIVDDGSEDNTADIIAKVSQEYSWIHPVRLATKQRYDLGKHYTSVCIEGFNRAFNTASTMGIQFEYIALSDADMVYPADYFENCMHFLSENEEYGIVSGDLLTIDSDGDVHQDAAMIKLGDGVPFGTGRVWRRHVFEATGGYTLAKCPDVISNIKAIFQGWRIVQLDDVVCYQTRGTAEGDSLWKGYFDRGQRSYYLNRNPLNIINDILLMIIITRPSRSILRGVALFVGYFDSLMKRSEKVDDQQICQYMGSYRRTMRMYWLVLKRMQCWVRR